jgi:hypothetical protein
MLALEVLDVDLPDQVELNSQRLYLAISDSARVRAYKAADGLADFATDQQPYVKADRGRSQRQRGARNCDNGLKMLRVAHLA